MSKRQDKIIKLSQNVLQRYVNQIYQKSTLQKSSRERQITAKQCSRNQSTNVTQLSKNVNL